MNIRHNVLRIVSHGSRGLLLFLLLFVGCADAGTATLTTSSPVPNNDSNPPRTTTPPPSTPPREPIREPVREPILAATTYKPFASEHSGKFSLGDFASPYLIRLDDYTNFSVTNSSILLNDIANEVTKTIYQGNTYLGIDDFSFPDYTSFISTNDKLTVKVNLMRTNGSVIVSGAVARALVVTGATNLYTWQDLQAMTNDVSGEYVLMNGITFPARGSEGLAMEGFEPVGYNFNPFTGSFAGNGHGITNLSIERSGERDVGMWGWVRSANAMIKDFVIDHAGIRGRNTVGGVVGILMMGTVTNVGVVSSQNSNVSAVGNFAGGLVGQNQGTVNQGTVVGYVTGAVSGGSEVGGLVGRNQGTVMGYASGAVNGRGDSIGGLVGSNGGGTVIGYASGAILRTGNMIGGLVGSSNGRVIGYWDERSSGLMSGVGADSGTFEGRGISSIANVVFDRENNAYTDNRGTDETSDDEPVFDNGNFSNYLNLLRSSAAWSSFIAENLSPQSSP